MLDGRVKTLHPKIHAGILHDRQNKSHKNEMINQKFPSIDLIVVNFYPFQNIVRNSKNSKNIIENIDIGGPTMVRAAAKNFKNVTIITNKNIDLNDVYLINENQYQQKFIHENKAIFQIKDIETNKVLKEIVIEKN